MGSKSNYFNTEYQVGFRFFISVRIGAEGCLNDSKKNRVKIKVARMSVGIYKSSQSYLT
jgi:hypothetical protein